MLRKSITLAAASTAALLAPAGASAHISFHPNAIPAGSEVTFTIRVPNEEANAKISSVRVQLPEGVLEADGAPPSGWSYATKTKKLSKPITTDDGTVTDEVTEIDFTGGDTPPGQIVQLPVVMSLPDSAKAGDVVTFPTIQTYSGGQVVRWIDTSADADNPAPTIDITPAGGPLLDVTGGDAGPPAKLPANLLATASVKTQATPAATKSDSDNTLAIIALIVGALGLLVGGAALLTRRKPQGPAAAR